jgi:hypothetical protein
MELLGARDIFEMAKWFTSLHDKPAPCEVGIATPDGRPVSLWGGLEIGPVQNVGKVSSDIHTCGAVAMGIRHGLL